MENPSGDGQTGPPSTRWLCGIVHRRVTKAFYGDSRDNPHRLPGFSGKIPPGGIVYISPFDEHP